MLSRGVLMMRKRIHDELVNLEVAEYEFYRQKAKMHWLNEGDLNIRFFHQMVESNKKMNTIRVIKGEDGQYYDTFEGMATELMSFFTNLIGVEDPFVKSSFVEDLKGMLNYSLLEGAADFLIREVSDMEIKESKFKQENYKSTDPDGYTSGFFKVDWDIIGTGFTSAVRLAPFFPGMISLSQLAFFKGRNIVDNTLLAQEIVKGYSKKSLSPRCAVKIDLQKAFDSVSWEFLLNVLATMGIPGIFCNWIKLGGYFKGARGIMQGYPLSPNRFVIAMNVLSTLLDVTAKHSRQLVLPKGIIRDIKCLCMCFFWKGSDSLAKGASVGWNQICSLKSEGSLWIAWIIEYCLKTTSFWDVECKAHFSWILSKLLSMREEDRRLFFPCANWSLIKGKWIWDNIRDYRAKVNWHKLIWFPAHIPKFSLISWIVILDRLLTKDRLVRFGLAIDNVCGLCGLGIESRDHFFVECSFAKEVWDIVLTSCDVCYDLNNCDDLFNWLIANLKSKSRRVRILKLAWTGLLYSIWEERNHRLFRGSSRSVDVIVNSIKVDVRVKLCRYGMFRLDNVNRCLYLNWGLS
ncbi:uncharacterized protein LOC120208171 [Hibiscus syriacus]|uniref:uncharacterized protein LOC120208171 n=1 Tax=Hibiscus syriacus TaxID=106335 RepID=UPI0019235620|nr:uncharacterized protein LOC120208171 [Hibiscus syriacus]